MIFVICVIGFFRGFFLLFIFIMGSPGLIEARLIVVGVEDILSFLNMIFLLMSSNHECDGSLCLEVWFISHIFEDKHIFMSLIL